MVAQVVEAVVDGSSRQHKHFGFDSGANYLVHQLEIAVLARILVVLIGGNFAAVTEIMALVNYHKVIIAPVYVFKVEAIALPRRARQVGMIENIITQTVGDERVIDIVAAIGNPVVVKFFRTENKNGFVAVL